MTRAAEPTKDPVSLAPTRNMGPLPYVYLAIRSRTVVRAISRSPRFLPPHEQETVIVAHVGIIQPRISVPATMVWQQL